MKRPLRDDSQEFDSNKKQRTSTTPQLASYDDIVHSLHQFDSQQLHNLAFEIEGSFSAKLNLITQDFPSDLWVEIFRHAECQKIRLHELLPLRTVCKTWDKIICGFPKINTEDNPAVARLAGVFASLRKLSVDETTKIQDFELFTALNSLKVTDNSRHGTIGMFTQNLSEFSNLTNLTKLTLNSHFVNSVEPLTSLQSLSIKAPFQIQQAEVLKHPKLTRVVCNASRFFRQGQGILKTPTGCYEGEFLNGSFCGMGKIVYATGSSYEGQFKDHRPCGQGTWNYANGIRYVGSYSNGAPNGKGIIYYPEEGKFDGTTERLEATFKDGRVDGIGVLYYRTESGDRYEGGIDEECRKHGPGTNYFLPTPDECGYRIEAVFNRGVIDGPATLYQDDGVRYEGEFDEEDMRHGVGTVYFPDGDKIVGKWNHGDFGGHGVLHYAAGDRYEGGFNDALERHGHGTMYFANDDVYVGEFFENGRTGQGTMVYANGDRYVGQWHNAERSGYGVLGRADGTKQEGQWKDDKFEGENTGESPVR